MAVTLPLTWADKINNPELLAALEQFGENQYLTAQEINTIRDAINYLYENNVISETLWGDINGDISLQIDLINLLNLKSDKSDTYTKSETDSRIQDIVGSAPAALDTLAEIAAQLENDNDAISSIITSLSQKEDSSNKSTSVSESGSNIKFPVWSVIVSYFSASRLRTILGITTLSGSNTGDQDLSGLVTNISNKADKNNTPCTLR